MRRIEILGWALCALGAVVLLLTIQSGLAWSQDPNNVNHGLYLPDASEAPGMLSLLLGGALLAALGPAVARRPKLSPPGSVARVGTWLLISGVILGGSSLAQPWWDFSLIQTGYPGCLGSKSYFPFFVQQSSAGCTATTTSVNWWYSGGIPFSSSGTVALTCGAIVLAGVALGCASLVLSRPKERSGRSALRWARAALVTAAVAAAAEATAVAYFALALPHALAVDWAAWSPSDPYAQSFWGASMLSGPPFESFHWGPLWGWALPLCSAFLMLLGAGLRFRGTHGRPPSAPPPG